MTTTHDTKPGALALGYLKDREATLRDEVRKVADHPAREWGMAQLGRASRGLADMRALIARAEQAEAERHNVALAARYSLQAVYQKYGQAHARAERLAAARDSSDMHHADSQRWMARCTVAEQHADTLAAALEHMGKLDTVNVFESADTLSGILQEAAEMALTALAAYRASVAQNGAK